MATLGQDTKATLIHGITGQEVADSVLSAGTQYSYEGLAAPDYFGTEQVTILVENYRYRVPAEAVRRGTMAYTCRTCRKELVEGVDYIHVEGIDDVENPECATCTERRDIEFHAYLDQERRKESEEGNQ